jgi:hypothetical protein
MDKTRASDAEREQTAEQLRYALVEGRLSLEEFTERVGAWRVPRNSRYREPVSAWRRLLAPPPA